MKFDAYWEKLAEIGWLDYLSPEQQSEIRDQLKKNLAAKKSEQIYAYLALATAGLEYGDCDFKFALTQIAEMSGGTFRPTAVKVRSAGNQRTVIFRHGGKLYQATFDTPTPVSDDFLELANKALKDNGTKQRFISLPVIDSLFNLVFVPPKVFKAAVSAGLIPRQEDLPSPIPEDDW